WLEDLARNARDQEVRDLARKVLDDARKDRESSPALPKGPPRDDAKDGPPCECKGGGDGKSAGTDRTAGNGQQGGQGKSEGGGEQPQGAGKSGGQGRPNGEQSPIAKGHPRGLNDLDESQDSRPGTADPSHRRRAGVLQVEDFTRIDKDILKDLNMTPEEW